MTRFLSLSLPFLATDRIDRLMRAQGLRKPPDAPLATVIKVKSAQRLTAVDRRARALGLQPGMTLTDARAMRPSLICVDADARAEAQTLENITDWCRRFTPLAALDAPDGVMLDVSGAAHLFGGEAKLLAKVEARLKDQGFGACAAIASTPEAAWALARYGALRILPPSLNGRNVDEKELARRLGDLPLAALRLDTATLADLAQAGLRRISDILMRPRAPITARFGPLLHARLDGLLGASKTAISPRFEAPAYLAERRFLDGIVRREDIETTILSLAQDLSSLLFRHDEGARRLKASLFRVDGMVKHFEVGTSQPLREPKAIARLFHECIERASAENGGDALDPGYGFDVIRLAALVVERQTPEQADWDTSQNETADLVHLIDRLGARLGLRRVTRLAFNATHIPEFAITAVPAATLRNSASLTPPPFEARTKGQADAAATHALALPSRPIRLLQRPEPIETIACVPDGPPLRFRWRRIMHEVSAIEGPERIAPEWWNDETALTRDYFRAEDSEGQRFWLFREGLFNDETAQPRWFMHGLFA
jgi:protein ImuB